MAILPVTINSPEKIDYMREGLLDMLSSRVSLDGRVSVIEKRTVKKALSETPGEVDLETAMKVGAQLEADYVVFGSLTKLGDSASLDLKVLDVKGEKPASSVFVQAKKMEEIVAAVDDIANQVDEKILGYSLRPPVVAKAPEKVVKEAVVVPAPMPGFQSAAPAQAPRAVPTGAEFQQSFPFPFRIAGMAIGDVDGDGRNEIVLMEEKSLSIYRYEEGFKLLKKIDGARVKQNLAVDVGDIDKDGKAEIFVTSYEGDLYGEKWRLSSFVVAFKDGDFKVVASDLDWFLRVVNWGDRGPVLLGQGRLQNVAFAETIYEMGWDGKKYKDIRKAPLPKIYSIYGFTPFVHEGKTNYFFIDSDFRGKVVDARGTLIWKSQGAYGSGVSFRIKPLPSSAPAGTSGEGDEWAYVNTRVISRGSEVLIIQNIPSTLGGFLKRGTTYLSGNVQSLVWSGAMFQPTWQTPVITGYLADFQTQAIDGQKGTQLVLAVNLLSDSILSGGTQSTLVIGRLQ